MKEIRKLFISEHFTEIGFIYGMRYIDKKTGRLVGKKTIDTFIETGVFI